MDTHEHVIEPTSGWRNLGLQEVWESRELLWFLTLRDLKTRYKQMALGPTWIILRPLMTMVVFSVVFGGIAHLPSDGIPYPLFTFAALVPWTYFQTAVSLSSQSLVSSISLISKVYFPRLIVPIASSLSGIADLFFSFGILACLMAWYGWAPNWWALMIPLYVVVSVVIVIAVGLLTASFAVKYRDLQYGLPFILQVWMYATPVAYSASLIPQKYQLIYKLNPMFWVVAGFRYGLLGNGVGPQPLMAASFAGVLVALVLGAYIFRRAERTIVDLQ